MKPFDLEAAKRGDPIRTYDGTPIVFVAGPDRHGHICGFVNECLRVIPKHSCYMSSLCQVEGKDVYPGDVVYFQGNKRIAAVGGFYNAHGFLAGGLSSMAYKKYTWTPPPQMIKRWMGLDDKERKNVRGWRSEESAQYHGMINRIRIAGVWHDITDGFEIEVTE